MSDPTEAAVPLEGKPKANGNGAGHGPPVLTLPYADFSHALIRAHHDAHAMAAANRVLADSLRDVLRRQQDLAFELTEAALNASKAGPLSTPAAIFDRAAQAVREVGEAIIDAQIDALRRLQSESDPGPDATTAFPPAVVRETPTPARPSRGKAP